MRRITKNEIRVFSFILGTYTFWFLVLIALANILL